MKKASKSDFQSFLSTRVEKSVSGSVFARRVTRQKNFLETGFVYQFNDPVLQAPAFKLIFCGKEEYGKRSWSILGTKNPLHGHFGLGVIIDGSCKAEIGKKQYTFHCGDVLVIHPAKEDEYWNVGKNCKMIEVIFSCGIPERYLLAQICSGGEPVVLSAPHSSKVVEKLQELYKTAEKNENDAAFECSCIIYSCILYINRMQKQSNLNTYHKLLAILETFAFEKYDLDFLAKTCGMSRRKLNSYFRTTLNTTPVEYIRFVRMKFASNLLRTSELSINEIAEACAYNNTSYFCRDFRRIFKKTPGEFRKKELQE